MVVEFGFLRCGCECGISGFVGSNGEISGFMGFDGEIGGTRVVFWVVI